MKSESEKVLFFEVVEAENSNILSNKAGKIKNAIEFGLCEGRFLSPKDPNNRHLTGSYRVPDHSKCDLNTEKLTKKLISFL